MNLREGFDLEKYTEYEKLGRQLQQMTLRAVAEKFEVHASSITAIRKLDDNDISLIRELGVERKRMMVKRARLRTQLK